MRGRDECRAKGLNLDVSVGLKNTWQTDGMVEVPEHPYVHIRHVIHTMPISMDTIE